MARRRQPRGEAELVEPVELADLDRQQPLDARPGTAGSAPGRPTSGPSAGPGRRGRRSRSPAGPRRGAATYATRGRMTSRRIAAMPSSRPIANSGWGVGPLYSRHERDRRVAVPGHRPSASARTRAPRGRRCAYAAYSRSRSRNARRTRLVGRRPGDDAPRRPTATVAISRPPAMPSARARARRRRRAAGSAARKPGIAAQRAAAALATASRRPGLERRADDALLGDDPGDQLGRA